MPPPNSSPSDSSGTEVTGAYTELTSHLSSLPDFVYRHNPGNAGDALIYLGFCHLAHLTRSGPIWFDARTPHQSRHLLYGGGGSLTPEHSRTRAFLLEHFDHFESITLLPCTIAGNEDLLTRMDQRFVIFCREKQTYDHCTRHCPASVRIIPQADLAFRVPRSEASWRYSGFPRSPRAFRYRLKLFRRFHRTKRVLHHVENNFFRTDKESARISLPPKNSDLPAALRGAPGNHFEAISMARTFFRLINQTEEVNTDRLHVAIAASLLGKPTRLYANNYFKNEAVFQFSLRDHYPLTTFVPA